MMQSQIDAYREMTRLNKMREGQCINGSNPAKFECWLDSIDQATHISKRYLKKELMKKSDGVVHQTLSMMSSNWSDDDIIAKL